VSSDDGAQLGKSPSQGSDKRSQNSALQDSIKQASEHVAIVMQKVEESASPKTPAKNDQEHNTTQKTEPEMLSATVLNLSIDNTGKEVQEEADATLRRDQNLNLDTMEIVEPKKTSKKANSKKESMSSQENQTAQKKRQDAFEKKNVELQRRRE